MIPLRITGKSGPVQRKAPGHRTFHTSMRRDRQQPSDSCDCVVCRSDCAGIVPCARGTK